MRLPLGDGTPWNGLSNGADPGSPYQRVLYDGATQTFGRDVQKYLTVFGQILYATDGNPFIEVSLNGVPIVQSSPVFVQDAPPAIATMLRRLPVSSTDVVTAYTASVVSMLTGYLEYDLQTDIARSVVPFTPGQLSTPFACPVFDMSGFLVTRTIHTGTPGLQENITLRVAGTAGYSCELTFQSAETITRQLLSLSSAAPFDFVVLDDIPMVGVTITAENFNVTGPVIYGHVTR